MFSSFFCSSRKSDGINLSDFFYLLLVLLVYLFDLLLQLDPYHSLLIHYLSSCAGFELNTPKTFDSASPCRMGVMPIFVRNFILEIYIEPMNSTLVPFLNLSRLKWSSPISTSEKLPNLEHSQAIFPNRPSSFFLVPNLFYCSQL